MRNTFTLILFAISLAFLAGCGQTKVTGTVKFSDGEPLTTGTVVFENDQRTYRAALQSNGTFSMGMLKDGEGIPSGEYRVAVLAMDPATTEIIEGAASDPRLLTHSKYASSHTSGLTYNVQKNMNIEIVVERP